MIRYRGTNGQLTWSQVDENFRTLDERLDALDDADGVQIVDVAVDGSTIAFALSDGSTLGPFTIPRGIGEAPNDGRGYLRQGLGWVVPAPAGAGGSGISHADSSGGWYASHEGDWEQFTPLDEAPTNGMPHARQDGQWVVISSGGGIADAPSDGVLRGRLNGAWAEITGGAGGGMFSNKGTYSSTASYHGYDVVRFDDMWWFVSPEYGTVSNSPPSYANVAWVPMSLPRTSHVEGVTGQFYHEREDGSLGNLRAVINDLRTRLATVEARP